jgi:ABC-2 type transport system ATP-binding protein
MEEAQELSDRIGIIDRGELVAVGTMDELTRKVGRHDTIRLKIDGQSASTDLTDRMRALPGVHSVAAESGSILMQVTDGDQLLPELISVLQEAGASLRGIDIKEPNLEAVFLHLTGRALRD